MDPPKGMSCNGCPPVPGAKVGTLEYMAPELLMRTAAHSRASDVYAFAVTLNEMATGGLQ